MIPAQESLLLGYFQDCALLPIEAALHGMPGITLGLEPCAKNSTGAVLVMRRRAV